jgi:hypothetical protein
VSLSALSLCPTLAYVIGTVAPSATQVKMSLSNGETMRASAIVPPSGLAQDVRYFVTRLPCGPRFTGLVAVDATGKVVGRSFLGAPR